VTGRDLEGRVRIVFVGRATEERKWTLTAPAAGLEPSFVDHRGDDVVERVAAQRPDVVVVFGPERLQRDVARALPGLTVACLLDQLPGPLTVDTSPWRTGEALDETIAASDGDVGAAFDAGGYDRVLATDARVARLGLRDVVWRSPPLAVDDALYRLPGPPPTLCRPLFIGESTPHREAFLVDAKHNYDLRHYAFGLADDRLARVLGETTVGVVMAPGPFTTFEPNTALHLAAGHLLLAGPLVPPRGLESGLDHLSFDTHGDLMRLLFEIEHFPGAYEAVRQRGRVRAEEFRASRIWPRLVRDLLLDIEAFGSPRR
jgi:hypothetical protein